ncbi:MAG: DNA-directed RNA polymerase subunit H [Candidatus Hodarchaeales archaeon]|jgi:DNA-directed RNA polymerase subunit H (RpoH/RPB5)
MSLELRRKKVIEGAKSILKTREFKVASEGYNSEGEHYDLVGEKTLKGKKKIKIIVRIPDDDPVGVTKLRDFKAFIEEKSYDEAIILALTKYTHYTKKEAEAAGIETFSIKFPFFDLFQHELVPIHEFATEEEIQIFVEKYAVDVKQLPKILVNDPAVQLLGANAGDIIKIIRDSPTAGKYITYRYCIE